MPTLSNVSFLVFSTPHSLTSISTPDYSLNDTDDDSPTFSRHTIAAMPRLSISTEDEGTLSMMPLNKGMKSTYEK